MAKDKISSLSSLSEKMTWASTRFKTNVDVNYIDTGSIILNKLFGGGLPLPTNIQIYSESGYGKSTITLSICKSLCQQGHRVLYIDAEGSINENLLRTMRILTDDENNLLYNAETNPDGLFVVIQISYFEDIEEILETLIPRYDKDGIPLDSDFRLVVIDSVAALAPKEFKADSGEKLSVTSPKPGIIAKAMTSFLRKFNGYKTAFNLTFIYINQLRENLSMGYGNKYEDAVPGGKAVKFYSDIVVKLTSRGVYKRKVITGAGEEQEVATEREIGITTTKNKITDGQVTLPLQVVFGKGISNLAAMPYILKGKRVVNQDGELVNMIEGSGAWFTLSFIKENSPVSIRCNGANKLKEAIRENYRYIAGLITEEDFKALESIDGEDGNEFI